MEKMVLLLRQCTTIPGSKCYVLHLFMAAFSVWRPKLRLGMSHMRISRLSLLLKNFGATRNPNGMYIYTPTTIAN